MRKMNNYQLTIKEVLDIIKMNTELVRDIMNNDTLATSLHKHSKTKLISAILTYQYDLSRITLELSESVDSFNIYQLAINDTLEMIDSTIQDSLRLANGDVTVKGLTALDKTKLVALYLTYETLIYRIEEIMEDVQNAE